MPQLVGNVWKIKVFFFFMRYSFVLSGQIVGKKMVGKKWLPIFNLSIENGIWWYFFLVTGASIEHWNERWKSLFSRSLILSAIFSRLLYTENQFALHKSNVMWQWDFSNWLKVHKVNTLRHFSTLSSLVEVAIAVRCTHGNKGILLQCHTMKIRIEQITITDREFV